MLGLIEVAAGKYVAFVVLTVVYTTMYETADDHGVEDGYSTWRSATLIGVFVKRVKPGNPSLPDRLRSTGVLTGRTGLRDGTFFPPLDTRGLDGGLSPRCYC